MPRTASRGDLEVRDYRGDHPGSEAYGVALGALMDVLADLWAEDALAGHRLTAEDPAAQDGSESGAAGRGNVATAPHPNVERHARAALILARPVRRKVPHDP